MTPPDATTTAPPDLLAGYPGGPGDLAVGPGGAGAHWHRLGAELSRLGLPELRRRQSDVRRLLEADGVTYHVHDGAAEGGSRRPSARRWRLDPVPMVLAADEWATIEAGILQRTELLNLVLTDLYGERELLTSGTLPPELVLGHGGYVRGAVDVRVPGFHQLFTAALDLVRGPDGWRVISHRTEAPSGAGYALENRTVLSRVLPDVHRRSHVQRLAPWFRALRAGLQAAAPATDADPRIVVLTPGQRNETAFEHALLASQLGVSLVEGEDLVVRDGRVWMRSLGRREPVDVVLRRVDTDWCDPLELYADSHLGTPGLLEAARRGRVTVLNTLGSGVLEHPGLHAYLPGLSERLLGQPLRLPSARTLWCGDPEHRREVLADPARFVLRVVQRRGRSAPLAGWELSGERLAATRSRIEARPWRWVAQEPVEPPTVPVLGTAGFEPRRANLRTFVVASDDGYVAMPGGLTRVARGDDWVVSNQTGAITKDTWVLAAGPEPTTGFWLRGGPVVAPEAPEASMSSRAAEHLFWLGRYAERGEDTLRLLRVVGDRTTEFEDVPSPAGQACVSILLAALTEVTTTWPGFVGEDGADHRREPADELRSLAADAGRPGSLAFAVRRMVECAEVVRDQLSLDTFGVLTALSREVLAGDGVGPVHEEPGRAALSRALTAFLAFQGLGAESLVRDLGWQFLEAGRRLERVLGTVALLRATVAVEHDAPTDSLLLESVLTATESIVTYRRRYRSRAQLQTVLDLLVGDPDNPRSVAHQLDRLLEAVGRLPSADGEVSAVERAVREAATAVRLPDTARLARADDADGDAERGELLTFLRHVESLLRAASLAVEREHFVRAAPQRRLVHDTPEPALVVAAAARQDAP